jgi:chitin disaccharide deacetylase
MPPTFKPLIVCADDFGIEPGVDAAIVDLAQSGRLSATGCLVTAVRFPMAAPLLSGLPVDIGLHLNFTECLGLPGFYAPLGKLIALTYTRRLSRSQVRGQINTQLDLFEQHVKRVPDFVDGHLHVHQFPVIREELLGALTERFGKKMPWLRDTQPTQMSHALPFMQRFKAHVIGALGARSLVRQATRVGAIMNDGFMGAYDFSRPHPPYLVMLAEWLKHARINSVLMTHPAQFASENLAFGRDRIEEYRVLGSEDFIALLEKNQLTIARLSQSGISQ